MRLSVIAPFITRPGTIPRKIEIERKKRLFAAQNLEELLRAEGVDYSRIPQSSLLPLSKTVGTLPLEVFDNDDFEERPWQEWVRLAAIGGSEGAPVGVPARALFMDRNGQGSFKAARVMGYNEGEKKFEVHWEDLPGLANSLLARMHICFRAEDPFNYVQRVVDAHRRRKDAEMAIVYNLYVDCMPVDTLPDVDAQQAKRILATAISTKALHQSPPDTAALIAEVRIQASRSLNRMAFDTWARREPKHSMIADVTLPAAPAPKPVPERGVIPLPIKLTTTTTPVARGLYEVPATGYGEKAHGFSFNSFLTKLELIKIIVSLRAECLKVLTLNFFSIITKSVRLEEFTNLQTLATAATAQNLKETWPSNVQNFIRAQLKDMRKGWFNLEETNNEVYSFSKLKKFLTFVNFVMQVGIAIPLLFYAAPRLSRLSRVEYVTG
jgi:dynein heavy chain, axonemal